MDSKKLEERENAYKKFYLEINIPWYKLGAILPKFASKHELYVVTAPDEADAILRVLKDEGLAVTQDNVDLVSVLTKEQYDIKKIERALSRVTIDTSSLRSKTLFCRGLSITAICISSVSLVISVVIAAMVFLAAA